MVLLLSLLPPPPPPLDDLCVLAAQAHSPVSRAAAFLAFCGLGREKLPRKKKKRWRYAVVDQRNQQMASRTSKQMALLTRRCWLLQWCRSDASHKSGDRPCLAARSWGCLRVVLKNGAMRNVHMIFFGLCLEMKSDSLPGGGGGGGWFHVWVVRLSSSLWTWPGIIRPHRHNVSLPGDSGRLPATVIRVGREFPYLVCCLLDVEDTPKFVRCQSRRLRHLYLLRGR